MLFTPRPWIALFNRFALAALGAQLVLGADPPLCPGAWTLVHIPDAQNYVKSASLAPLFAEETRWIAEQSLPRNIRFAVQVGDLTDNNGETQWNRARSSLDFLNQVVPFACCSGNHDCGPAGSGQTHDSLFSRPDYLGVGSPYQRQPTFGGFFHHPADAPGNTQNSWHTFRVDRQDFLVLACEWGPRNQVVSWMEGLVAARPFHRVILVVHAYLESSTSRYDWAAAQSGMNPHATELAEDPDGVNDGAELWAKLVSRYENFCLVCCGHAGRGFRTATGVHGNVVNEMLYNTQDLANGGDGWLRLLEFYPDRMTVRARSYSTVRDEWGDASDEDYFLRLSPVSSRDTDADAMPDFFEVSHGFGVSDPADAAADADGDGVTNREEFRACTNPLDPGSVFALTRLRKLSPAGEFEVHWRSVAGLRYRVEANETLCPAAWTPAGPVVTASGAESTGRLTIGNARCFFRVRLAPRDQPSE